VPDLERFFKKRAINLLRYLRWSRMSARTHISRRLVGRGKPRIIENDDSAGLYMARTNIPVFFATPYSWLPSM
jgi:hypothetical protein